MANILQQWISEQLENSITWKSESFGIIMKDGTIVAAVLKNYKVITENQKDAIIKTDVGDDIKKNWKYLSTWMKTLDVILKESEFNSLCNGDCSTHLSLLYQLFLNLDRRQRLDFINNEMVKTSPLVQKTDKLYRINPHIAKPFIRDLNFIEWQKRKAEELSIIYDNVRSKYLNNVKNLENSKYPFEWPKITTNQRNREKEDINEFQNKYPSKCEHYSHSSLIKLNEKPKNKDDELLDRDWAKSYMEKLQEKVKNRSETEKLQDQMRNVLETSVFENVVDEMEFEADQELTKKVMKLSQFEKEMCNKLLETKQFARRLIQDRVTAAKMYADRREIEFQEYLKELKNQMLHEIQGLDIEIQRQAESHKRLCTEQSKKKFKLLYKLCFDTIGDLIDFAIKVSDLRKGSCICNSGDEVLQSLINDWKKMFYMNQPLFELPKYDEDAMLEHVINLEKKSDILDKNDFIDYHNKVGPWLIENLSDDTDGIELFQCGDRILGYIVYQCLDIKYPPAPKKIPALLPNYKVASILLDIPSRSMIEPIQKLLKYRKIHVVQLESALSYCMGAYKNEMVGTSEEIFLEFSSCMTNMNEEKMNKTNNLEEYLKDEKLEEINEINLHVEDIKINLEEVEKMTKISEESVLDLNFKQTQTPKTIPESDITLSDAAELGKCAYLALRSGEALSDQLFVSLIVEYLKTIKEVNGFVLLGYPVTWKQMRILEEELTGMEIPENYVKNVLDTEPFEFTDSDQYNIANDDDLIHASKSLLVDDPRTFPIYEFSTYFTSYIKLKQTKNILSEANIWELTCENSTLLDRVYAEQGINYSIYYEKSGKDLLVQICRYIIGDFGVPDFDDDLLFGEKVLTNLEYPVNERKKNTSKKIKGIKNKKRSTKESKKGHISKVKEQETQIEVTQIDDKSEDRVIEDLGLPSDDALNKEIVPKEIVEAPNPGDEHWIFATPAQFATNEPIIAIATFWESIEKSYIENIEQLLHVRRIQFNYLVLYGRYTFDRINTVLSDSYKCCSKQEILSDFVTHYSDLEIGWCSDPVIRNDWLCRLDTVRTSLHNICDENKLKAVEERCNLIENNWTLEELIILANTYVSIITVEVNRTIRTLQMQHDYYSMIITNKPIFKEVANITGVPDTVKLERTKDGPYSKLKTLILNAFLDNNTLDEVYDEFKKTIYDNFQMYSKHTEKIANAHREILNKHVNVLKKPAKKKSTKRTPKKQEPVSNNIDKSMQQRTLDEWSIVLTAETNRCRLRLELLMSKALLDIQTFTGYMANIFKGVIDHINLRYTREIECVNRLHEILNTVLQKSKQITGTIILNQDQLIFDDSFMKYLAEPATPPDLSTQEEVLGYFKINQLAELGSKLKNIGPQGHMKVFSFIYIIQDWILNGQEERVNGIIPDIWMKLTVEEVPKIVSIVFGDAAFIDWRDFLIFCTDIKFPDLNEILTVRRSFRDLDIDNEESITREEFLNVNLWFENNENSKLQVLECCLLKHFLFELFECSNDKINYTAFLLAFCKDEKPEIGFAKAIGLSVGKEVCYDSDVCEYVILELMKKKQEFEEERARNTELANLYIEKVLENVFNTSDGLILTEVTEGESQLEQLTAVNISTQDADNVKTSSTFFKSNITLLKSNSNTKESKINFEENNSEIRFENKSTSKLPAELFNPDFVYSTCPNILFNILKITLFYVFNAHKCSENLYIQKYKRAIKQLKNDTANGEIYVTRFIYHEFMQELLHSNHKFHSCSIHNIVESIINSRDRHTFVK